MVPVMSVFITKDYGDKQMTLRFWLIALMLACSSPTLAADLFIPVPQTRVAAMAPDQRQMLTTLEKQKTTKSVRLVNINLDSLKEPTVTLGLRAGLTVQAAKKDMEKRSETDFTWYGTLSEVPGAATLVVRDGNITGTVRSDKELFKIRPVGSGLHALIEVDQSKFPPDDPPSFEKLEKRNGLPENKDSSAQEGLERAPPTAAANPIV